MSTWSLEMDEGVRDGVTRRVKQYEMLSGGVILGQQTHSVSKSMEKSWKTTVYKNRVTEEKNRPTVINGNETSRKSCSHKLGCTLPAEMSFCSQA